jgi:hypothetical protein
MSAPSAPSGNTAYAPNRAGNRTGQVSELSVIVPLQPGGADRLRALVAGRDTEIDALVASVGTLHDLRWIVFDDDTRLLFATTYDGDWDAYIDDFAAKIPDLLDEVFGNAVGYPGIKSSTIKDYIAEHQITATSWYSAYPDLRVTDIHRSQRIVAALDSLLDAVNP